MKRALFLDRDGVVNVDTGYLFRASEWRFVDGIFDVLRFFKERAFLLILVTNQSGIARGYYSERDFLEISHFMQKNLVKNLGFMLDKIYFCPHAPDENCECRKPRAGMILRACDELCVDASKSWILGDKPSDIAAARSSNVRNAILLNESGVRIDELSALEKPDFSVNSLPYLMEILKNKSLF